MVEYDDFCGYSIGAPYFKLSYYYVATYHDPTTIYPNIETVIYLGEGSQLREKFDGSSAFEAGQLYFQDAESYAQHGFLNNRGHKLERDEMFVIKVEPNRAKSYILDLEGLARELSGWNEKRIRSKESKGSDSFDN